MKYCFVVFTLLIVWFSQAQERTTNTQYFQSPLDIPIVLSGTFGELRGNHFHAGIDIKTQGVEGKRVLAAADGYVSRIKISPYGYGKALYVTHANGYTTVYAHLSRLSPDIETFTNKRQYKEQLFEVDLFPGAGTLQVKQGALIAYSGNSGGSGGPHLHFEIRETDSEKPVNPLLFGIGPTDGSAPLVNGLRIYPVGKQASVQNRKQPHAPNLVIERNGVYLVKEKIVASGTIGFGVNAFDRLDGASNQNGIYSLTMHVNGDTLYRFEAKRFAFHETRYINAHIDFAHFMLVKSRFHKTFVAPGNHLSMYPIKKNNGLLNIETGLEYDVVMEIADFAGNISQVQFSITGAAGTTDLSVEEDASGKLVRHNHPFAFQTDLVKIQIPAGILYDDALFQYQLLPPTANVMGNWHKVLDESIPAHSHFDIGIYGDKHAQQFGNKACVVSKSANGGLVYEGGTWKGDFLHASTRSFGTYGIAVDTTAPAIIPVNIRQGAVLSAAREIRVRITDNLSGIQSYNAYINGQWILMEYDAKNNLLSYDFDDRCPKGSNQFALKVVDKRGNIQEYQANFTR